MLSRSSFYGGERGGLDLIGPGQQTREREIMETLQKHTITGYAIAYPADYWEMMELHYPNLQEREKAQALGFDHFGRGERCFRCGFLCEGDGE